jgi:hypothetical protein
MQRLKVKFVDFWTDMNKSEDNYFYELLSRYYAVEISDSPDVVFYSCFGNDYLKYSCTRIFYSPENWRPDFNQCDYAVTFDYINDERHLRMPLWALYYVSYEKKGWRPASAGETSTRFEQWANRPEFCCMIVSNANAGERIEFFHRLNAQLRVDSAGKWNNTVGKSIPAGTENKFDFIGNYRFVISFENGAYPGYTTEKILEPLLAGCIPIYWGDPEVERDFNPRRFIHVRDSADYDRAIQAILDIEREKDRARPLLDGPIFSGDAAPVYLGEDYVAKKLLEWIDKARSANFKGVGSEMRERVRYYSALCKSGLSTFKNKLVQ